MMDCLMFRCPACILPRGRLSPTQFCTKFSTQVDKALTPQCRFPVLHLKTCFGKHEIWPLSGISHRNNPFREEGKPQPTVVQTSERHCSRGESLSRTALSSPAACRSGRGACSGAAGGFGVGGSACCALCSGVHLDHSAGCGLVGGFGLGRGAGSGGSGTGVGARNRLDVRTDRGAGTEGPAYGRVGCHVPVKAKAADMAFFPPHISRILEVERS